MQTISVLFHDRNRASRRQTLAVARALCLKLGLNPQAIQVFPVALPAWSQEIGPNLISTWTGPATMDQLKEALPELESYPDIIISHRPEVAGLALGMKEVSGGKIKLIHIENPNDNSHYRFDLTNFDCLVAQSHQNLEGENVIKTKLAIHDFDREIWIF